MSEHTSVRSTEMPGQTQVIRAVLAPAGSSQLQRSAPQACKHRIYLLTVPQIETCLLPLSCKIANSKHCNLPQALKITTGYLTCVEQITSKLKPLSLSPPSILLFQRKVPWTYIYSPTDTDENISCAEVLCSLKASPAALSTRTGSVCTRCSHPVNLKKKKPF